MNLLPAIYSLADTVSFWLPTRASTAAGEQDPVFQTILYVTGFFFVLVVGLMLFFVVRYHRRPDVGTLTTVTHNTPLEIAWTIIPLIIVMGFFVIGFRGYLFLDTPPSNAVPIEVKAQKWSFQFTYPNGGVSNNLYVPLNRPVVLIMSSIDVTHALYIPAFRIQKNIIAQRTTTQWFEAIEHSPPDGFTLFCTQYCGEQHSYMGSGNPDPTIASKCYALTSAEWDKKMGEVSDLFVDATTKQPRPYKDVGALLYKMSGCAGCHSVDGAKNTGPTWKGLYKRAENFAAGSPMPVVHPGGDTAALAENDKIWDDYLRESILRPDAKVVQGFSNVMPSFASQFGGDPGSVKDKKLSALVEYIKSVGDPVDYRPMPTPTAATAPGGSATQAGSK